MEKTSRSTKRLKSAKVLSKVVADCYQECNSAKENGKPVGWMPPMNGAIEIFYAMDLQPVFPENRSPVCAAFGVTPKNFEISESMGYSRDLCGHLGYIVGYINGPINDTSFPLGNLPEPDIILSAGGGCIPVMKIFHALERRFPMARVLTSDLPQISVEDICEHHIDYAISQINRLVEFLTEATGRKLDHDELPRRKQRGIQEHDI